MQLRKNKDSELTWTELDNNFIELANGKADKSELAAEIVRATAAETNKESVSNKGAPNGYAGLGNDGKVPTSQLPNSTGINAGKAVALSMIFGG